MQHAIYGNFSAPKVQEIVIARGCVLELVRPDDLGHVQTICSTEVFGNIRSLQSFRFPGSHEDYIIVGSDSGRIVILKFSEEKRMFQKIHQETYGKSGSRRIIPGEYLAVDPKGRACMIGALEKQKFVYVLNRDSDAQLTISSPLEAHKSFHITYDIVGLDMGFDNPQFAAIELDYGEVDVDPTGEAAQEVTKQLVIYELDLGLNSVTRKSSDPIDHGANKLISVPGAADGGPGGVLVCCENFLLYRNGDHPELKTVIPRRANLPPNSSVLITAAATLKQKSRFFTFIQTEHGDLFRVTMSYEGSTVSELTVKYFDSIPAATSICILRRGFLFAASEFSDHCLYQFEGLGDDDAVESSSLSKVKLENGDAMDVDGVKYAPVQFEPRYPLANLDPIDNMSSLAPVIDMKVHNILKEDTPQIFCACGRGLQSSLRLLRPGLSVTEMAISELPGNPVGVFTIKKDLQDEYTSFIVVAFVNATIVLRVGETVEQATDTGFETEVQTIGAQTMHDGSLVQFTPSSVRHIQQGGRVSEWQAPGRRNITRVAANERQAAIALAGGELVYFEMTPQGNLVETERKELGGDVSSLSLGEIPEGALRNRYLAVGSYDKTVRVLSLDPEDNMKSLNMQALTETPESLLFIDESQAKGSLQLQIGLSNGLLQRTDVDRVTGQMTDTRTRLLGAGKPVLCKVVIQGTPGMLALSSRPWIGYSDQGKYNVIPVSYDRLSHAATFSSEQCPEGFVGIINNSLRVIAFDRVGQFFNERLAPLKCTPREVLIDSEHNTIITIESDTKMKSLGGDAPMTQEEALRQVGDFQGSVGEWCSCIRIIDPSTMKTISQVDLTNNEAAISAALVSFSSSPDKGTVLCVGITKGLKFFPRKCDASYIKVYSFSEDGTTLSLIHSTEVDAIPRALAQLNGRLLAGIGSVVRLLDLGKKRLLRKCEFTGLPTDVASLQTSGSRIYVGDAYESVHFMKYKSSENKMYIFADDSIPRHITALCSLDYDTVAAADKFGNLTVLRLPAEMSAAVEEDPTAGKYANDGISGAPNKLQSIANIHIGDIITSIQKVSMQSKGKEIMLYTTLNGAVGAIQALSSRDSVDFFQHLEMHMRQEAPPLLGRDHLAYRSTYIPVKNIIDGDLCSQFGRLPVDTQKTIATELERTPAEVLKKIENAASLIV